MKKLIFTLFFLFIFCGNVNAKVQDITDLTTINNYSLPFNSIMPAETNQRYTFKYNGYEDSVLYSYLFAQTCTNYKPTPSVSEDCTDGCLLSTAQVVQTSKRCTQGNTYGYITYFFYTIGNYKVDTSQALWSITDYIYFYNSKTWNQFLRFDKIYFSDEDMYLSYSQTQNEEDMLNSIQTQIQQNQTIIDNQEQINDTLNNSTVDDPSGAFNQFESYLPENGVITDLITLPITLFQRVLSSINGTCSQYNLGNLLGTDLVLPCINISNYIGSTLWNVIDILFSGFFVLVIGKKMIKAFNNFTSMEEGDILD